MLLKLKFMCNVTTLDVVNNGTDTIIFKPEEILGILDLRSLGYNKIKQGRSGVLSMVQLQAR